MSDETDTKTVQLPTADISAEFVRNREGELWLTEAGQIEVLSGAHGAGHSVFQENLYGTKYAGTCVYHALFIVGFEGRYYSASMRMDAAASTFEPKGDTELIECEVRTRAIATEYWTTRY